MVIPGKKFPQFIGDDTIPLNAPLYPKGLKATVKKLDTAANTLVCEGVLIGRSNMRYFPWAQERVDYPDEVAHIFADDYVFMFDPSDESPKTILCWDITRGRFVSLDENAQLKVSPYLTQVYQDNILEEGVILPYKRTYHKQEAIIDIFQCFMEEDDVDKVLQGLHLIAPSFPTNQWRFIRVYGTNGLIVEEKLEGTDDSGTPLRERRSFQQFLVA